MLIEEDKIAAPTMLIRTIIILLLLTFLALTEATHYSAIERTDAKADQALRKKRLYDAKGYSDELLDQLRSNDPLIRSLDLSEEVLTGEELQALYEALVHNTRLHYIHWGAVPLEGIDQKEGRESATHNLLKTLWETINGAQQEGTPSEESAIQALTGIADKLFQNIHQLAVQGYSEALLDAIRANHPRLLRIDLRATPPTYDQLQALWEAIAHNSVLGHIDWAVGPLDEEAQRIKQLIDEQLEQNISDYTYHPSPFVHGLLAHHVYQNPPLGAKINFTENTEEWTVVQVKDDGGWTGFYSALYVNEATRQAVLAFQGTYHPGDFYEDVKGVILNQLAPQQPLAKQAARAAVAYAKARGLHLSITGHSLGGFHAEVAIAHYYQAPQHRAISFSHRDVQGIVFDSPGSLAWIEEYIQQNIKNEANGDFGAFVRKLPITSYLSHPNLINTAHDHPGTVYRLEVGGPWLGGHSIEALQLPCFDPATGYPSADKWVRMEDWPSGSLFQRSAAWSEDGFRRQHGGHHQESTLGFHEDILTEEYQGIDSYLLRLREQKTALAQLAYTPSHSVLQRMVRRYDIGRDKGRPSLKLTESGHVSTLRNQMRRVLEVVSEDYLEMILRQDGIIQPSLELLRYIADHAKVNHQHYVPRRRFEQELSEHLAKRGVCVVSGPGGIGKSTLAAAYARQQGRERHVYALSAATSNKLIEEVEEMANKLAIDYRAVAQKHQNNPIAYLRELSRKMYHQLQGHPILLIIDNAEKACEAIIKASLLDRPKGYQVAVIITTRAGERFAEEGGHLVLEPFSQEESRAYLQKRFANSKPVRSEAECEALLAAVGTIPKRLEIACSTLTRVDSIYKKRSVYDYIAHLRRYKSGQQGTFSFPEVPLGLEGLSEEAQLFMRYGSYLDEDGIPLSLLIEVIGLETESAQNEVMISLLDQSLISSGEEAGQVRIHREVRAACREYRAWKASAGQKESALMAQLVKVLAQKLPKVGIIRDEKWTQAAHYVPHAAKLVLEAESVVEEEARNAVAVLLTHLGHYRSKVQCNFVEGLEYQKQALAVREALYLGQPHLDVAVSLNTVGSSYEQLGNYREALSYKERSLKVHNQLPSAPQNEKEKAQVLNRLGKLYWHLGKSLKALKYAQEALLMQTRLFPGQPHPDTARYLNTLGISLDQLGRYEEALQCKTEALALRLRCPDLAHERKEGGYPNHYDMGHLLTNVGETLIKLGRYAEGTDYCQKSLAMRKHLHGDQAHHHIAYSLASVGVGLTAQGKAQEGLIHADDSLRMLNKVYKDRDHPFKVRSLHVRGKSLMRLERHCEAVVAFEAALHMQKRLYRDLNDSEEAPMHPWLASSLRYLGACYEQLGKREKAHQYYQKALMMLETLFPPQMDQPEHPELEAVRRSVARTEKVY